MQKNDLNSEDQFQQSNNNNQKSQSKNQKLQSKYQNQLNQYQNQEDINEELDLLKLIGKFQYSFDEFNKIKQQNMSVVLLVGATGCGKSTIFNFLSGADFIINHNQELVKKNTQNHHFKLIRGLNSITKDLHFYYNQENNHLIIDFPGFQDTNGEWDQLLFELLFHKFVTSGPLKIIYVIQSPFNSLPNRGSDLQEFIKQLCKKGNINVQKFNLLLNFYTEDLSDEELQNTIKDELRSVNILESIDKILVLRKVKKNEDIQQIFNINQGQIMWQEIQQIQSIEIQPQKLPKSEIISDYLRNKTLTTIEHYGVELCEAFDKQFTKLSDPQSQKIIINMKRLLRLIEKENEKSPLDWYINYVEICEQLAKTLQVKNEIITQSNNFKFIFTYFQQFSDLIKGYDEMKIIKSIAEDQLKKIHNIISSRLEILKTPKQGRAKLMEIEKEKQTLQQSIRNFQLQIQQLNNKLENSEKEHNQKIKDLENLYNKLQESQRQQNILDEQQLKEMKRQYQLHSQCLDSLKQKIEELQRKDNNQDKNINIFKQEIEKLKKTTVCQLI